MVISGLEVDTGNVLELSEGMKNEIGMKVCDTQVFHHIFTDSGDNLQEF